MTKIFVAHRATTLRTLIVAYALCLVGASALAGCASPQARAPIVEPRPLGAGLPAYAAPASHLAEAREQEPVTEEPRGDLTLRDALAAALLRNPDLAAYSWEIRVREARTLQAGLPPNPEVSVEVENVGGSGDFDGFDQGETTLALGQLIELGGKRMKRRRVAELGTTLASWDYEARRVAVFAEVARAFAAVLAAQEERALAQELLGLANESLASVVRQVRAGATSPVERTRAQVTVASQEIDQQRADAGLTAARLRLSALWGSREPQFIEARGDLRTVTSPPSLPALLARLEDSPEWARWNGEIALREAIVSLEDAKRIPNVTANAGVRRLEETDDTALVFGVSVPFPLYDQNQGERLAAHRGLAKSRHLRRAAHVRIETALRASLNELTSSFSEVEALREATLPQAEAAHRGVRDGYLRGLFRYVDVIHAQRTLFELRTRELDALRRYHGAVADIERLTGAPLEGRTWSEPTAPGTKGTRP
ncbi:MAG: TolC family protein [Myxococcales bacterium]|nr:TolC family protein [Myxococcales bacterium]